jgi:hypothetical protein
MIHFQFSVKPLNPSNLFISFYNYDYKLTTNKRFEADFAYDAYHNFFLSISTDFRGKDHAGPRIEIGLFGYNSSFAIYDIRHWDYKNNTWKNFQKNFYSKNKKLKTKK